MAGRKLNIRVSASTLMEVIVSMVIIVVVFGIAMTIFTNVMRSSLSAKKIKAQVILNETLLKSENMPNNINQSFTVGDFRIEQEVKPFNGDNNLTDIHLTAYDQNQQKVAELEKVIY